MAPRTKTTKKDNPKKPAKAWNHHTIPTSFKLMGMDYSIIMDDEEAGDHRVLGRVTVDFNRILLTTKADNRSLPADTIAQVFWHEVVHAIFSSMGEEKLRDDEKIVDLFASLLYQVIKTAEA